MEEVKQRFIDKMGELLGIRFYHLSNFLIYSKSIWKDYYYLFGEKESRIDLINSVSPQFFSYVQRKFKDSLILDLSKLMDPPFDSLGNENISFKAIFELLDEHLKENIKPSISRLKKLVAKLIVHRHKRIAHFDFAMQERISKSEIKEIPHQAIKELFDEMETCYNLITQYYDGSETIFPSHPSNSTVNLLYVLFDGKKQQEESTIRFYLNKRTPEDLERQDLKL